jgi:signal transduction histidine kinase
MEANSLVLIDEFCLHCDVDFSFINSLSDLGLIEILVLENRQYITIQHLKDVEKASRIHYELDINVEGIDVVFNLLDQINDLKKELSAAKAKLYQYELENQNGETSY